MTRKRKAKNTVQSILEPVLDELQDRGVEFVGQLHRRVLGKTAQYDPYAVLGVEPDEPMDAIRAVYNAKVKHYHPDNQTSGDAERFKRIQKAYEQIVAERGGR